MHPLVAILFCAVCSLPLPLVTHGTIQVGRFKSRNCNPMDIETFAPIGVHSNTRASRTMNCAFSCNRNTLCDRALFNASEKTCKQLTNPLKWEDTESLEDLLESSVDQLQQLQITLNNNYECLVLTKQTPHPSEPRLPLSKTTTPAPEPAPAGKTTEPEQDSELPIISFDTSFLLPFTMVTEEASTSGSGSVYQAIRISHGTDPLTGTVIISTMPRVLSLNLTADGSAAFAEPLKQDIKILTSLTTNRAITYKTNLYGNVTERGRHSFSKVKLMANEYANDNNVLIGIELPDTFDAIKGALLNGYRRIERNPTRTVIDVPANDIHFDMTENLVYSSESELKSSLYVTSFKESFNAKKRYIFRNQLNNHGTGLLTPSLSKDSEDRNVPWTMDTTWGRIVLNGDANTMRGQIEERVLQGRELRVVLDKGISSDVVSVHVTPTEVIVDLAQYLLPFEGKDCKNNDGLHVRYPVLSTSKRLVECETPFQNSLSHSSFDTTYGEIDWFFSTKNWTMVYGLSLTEGRTRSTDGSLQELISAVAEGRNLRVCVHLNDNNSSTTCHDGIAVRTTKTDDVILQTPPFLQKIFREADEFEVVWPDCRRVQRLVSTEGWIQNAVFTVGQTVVSRVTDVPFTGHSTNPWLVASLFLTFALATVGASSDPTFCRGKSSGLHADPKDCQSFYNCNADRTSWTSCPPGTLFNPDINNCDWARNVACDDEGTTAHSDSTTTEKSSCDGLSDGIYKDPEHCSKYFMCGSGRIFHFDCPSGLYYNPHIEACDRKENVDCSAQPQTKPTAGPATTDAVKTEKPAATSKNPDPESTLVKREMTTKQSQTEAPTAKVTQAPATDSPKPGSGCGRVVCYFTNWAQYRNGQGKQLPEHLDPFMCTHIVFAFAKMNGNQLAPYEWNDDEEEWNAGNYKKVMEHKKKNPNLKVLLAVGGWNMASKPFTAMVATQSNRKEFIDTSITFLRDRNFDGLDMDWEYPAARDASPLEDKDRFSSLLRELRAAYIREGQETNRDRLLLTAAVAAGKGVVDIAYDVPVLNSELDFINLMSYDLHGSWEKQTGHNSPLYPGSWESGNDAMLNVHWGANYWVEKGASRENLVIGVPLYGRTFRLASSSNSGVGAEAKGPGSAGTYTREQGFLAYYEICDMIKNGATKGFIKEQRVPYVVSGDQWAGYDDTSSVTKKVQYILEQRYGGVMVWDLSLDDMNGSSCGEGAYPLMAAINKACGK